MSGQELIERAISEGRADGARIAEQEARAGRGGRSHGAGQTLVSLRQGPLRALTLARGRELAGRAGLDQATNRKPRDVYAAVYAQAVYYEFLHRSVSPACSALQTRAAALASAAAVTSVVKSPFDMPGHSWLS